MIKKEMIAMLLAGGQGSRLGVLTSKVAKPAVSSRKQLEDFVRNELLVKIKMVMTRFIQVIIK